MYDESKFQKKNSIHVKHTLSLIHNLTQNVENLSVLQLHTQIVENLSNCAAVTYTECRELV